MTNMFLPFLESNSIFVSQLFIALLEQKVFIYFSKSSSSVQNSQGIMHFDSSFILRQFSAVIPKEEGDRHTMKNTFDNTVLTCPIIGGMQQPL